MVRMGLEHVLEFKYFVCVLDELGTNRMAASGRRVAGAIRSLVNAMGLQLEYARVFHSSLLISVLMYGNENDLEKEGEV